MGDTALLVEFEPARVEVCKSGDVAFTPGAHKTTMTDPSSKQDMHGHGRCVTGYRKKADGQWKAVVDINISETPLPAGK